MRVEWQEHLAVGVLEIDIQHKLLFDKFNAFLAACEGEIAVDKVNRLFWFLEGYAVTHFNDEERLMQRLAFPGLQIHRERHRAFAGEVGKFKERLRIEGATPGLIATVKVFVTGWLNEHISTMDRAIGQFVKATQTLL
jgi:hemerythrin